VKRFSKTPFLYVGGSLVLLLVGFIGGQITPTVVPQKWLIGQSKLDFNDLNTTYDLLKRKFDGSVDSTKAMEGARAGIISSVGDPYTTYLDPAAAKALNDQLSGTLSGIGAEIAIKNKKLTVVAPIAESPAAKAGLQAGDYIGLIDGKDTSEYTLDEAVGKIRGDKGTKVKLTIVRGNGEPKELTITRDTITVPSVKWSMKADNIGYIQVSDFGTDTSEKINQAATELKQQGAKGIILDVRNNPGGYVDAAVNVISQFTPAGKTAVEERHGGKTVEKLQTTDGGLLVGLPTVVLINGGSASASEITAGALRDNNGAKLIGEKSFGKGSVQEITKLANGSEIKITVAHWFTPSGKGIDKVGISPDIEIKMTADDVNAGRDPQLDRAIQELQK
jgi:carboxyl-terminal processing protease